MNIWAWFQIIAVFALVIVLVNDVRLLRRMWDVQSKLAEGTRKRSTIRIVLWAVLLVILGVVSMVL